MNNKILKARVKKTGEVIEVYKLNDGRFNRYMGEKISVSKIDQEEHKQIFTEDQLEIPKGQ